MVLYSVSRWTTAKMIVCFAFSAPHTQTLRAMSSTLTVLVEKASRAVLSTYSNSQTVFIPRDKIWIKNFNE